MNRQEQYDVIIVGQGLAGTTLAWRLIEAGHQVGLIDPGARITSSRIAAGLLTPITGKNLALSPTYGDEIDEAEQFYRRIEARLGASFYSRRMAVRLLKDSSEQLKWRAKARNERYLRYLVEGPSAEAMNGLVVSDFGHFAMASGQLDAAAYIERSRDVLDVAEARLDWARDVVCSPDQVTVRGKTTRWLISCEGYQAHNNPYWSSILNFRAAKGEILTYRLDRPVPPVTWHRDIWAAPTMYPDQIKVGSTFSWNPLDDVPTESARNDLETKMKSFFKVAGHLERQDAAVRPIIGNGHPVVVQHPQHSKLLAFNGLAAKGSLRAPIGAGRVVRLLEQLERGGSQGAGPCD